MPRSRYLYAVIDRETRVFLAAFTVKKEMLAWVGESFDDPCRHIECVHMRDGDVEHVFKSREEIKFCLR